MRNDKMRSRRMYAFSLDNRRIALIFAGGVVVLAVVFAIGVVIGKGLVKIQASAPPLAEYPTAAKADNPAAGEAEAPKAQEAGPIVEKDLPTEAGQAAPEGKPEAKEGEIKYTFYDTLEGGPKGGTPAASPPAEEKKPEAAAPPPAPTPAKEVPEPAKPAAEPRKEPVERVSGKAPAAPVQKARASARRFYYTVQVAAFPDPAQAEKLADRLKSKGINAYITEARVKGSLWHRVRVGKFADRAGAENMARAIQEKEKLNTFIDILYE